MQSAIIVLMCVAAAVGYGIVHDQVTARICVEYFTIGHPPIFDTNDPTLLGLGWGIIATWWAGLILGVLLAIAARAGQRRKRPVSSLIRPIVSLFAAMACGAIAAGILGWVLASTESVFLVGPIAHKLPPNRHVPFLANMWAHSASYLIGLLGALVVLAGVWRSRNRAESSETHPTSKTNDIRS